MKLERLKKISCAIEMLIKSELDIAMIIRGYILQLIVPFTFYHTVMKNKKKIVLERGKIIFLNTFPSSKSNEREN